MNRNNHVLWLTRTALMIALLVVLQAATAPMGNLFITGSIVNFLLITSVMLCGLPSGLTVSVLSPIVAKLFGIGPSWALIPFIIAGNAVLALIWYSFSRSRLKPVTGQAAALIAAACMKTLVLYLGIVKLAVPCILKLPEPQATVIAGMFSLPQLITALAGGLAAMAALPALKKALKTSV